MTDRQRAEIESLRAQVAELRAENKRIQAVVDQSIDDGIDKIMAMSDEQIDALARYEGRSPEDQATIAKQCFEIAALRVENASLQEENDALRRIHAENISILKRQLAEYKADAERYRNIKPIIDKFPEINQSNYDHDDACNLNAWGVELVLADAALAATKGES